VIQMIREKRLCLLSEMMGNECYAQLNYYAEWMDWMVMIYTVTAF